MSPYIQPPYFRPTTLHNNHRNQFTLTHRMMGLEINTSPLSPLWPNTTTHEQSKLQPNTFSHKPQQQQYCYLQAQPTHGSPDNENYNKYPTQSHPQSSLSPLPEKSDQPHYTRDYQKSYKAWTYQLDSFSPHDKNLHHSPSFFNYNQTTQHYESYKEFFPPSEAAEAASIKPNFEKSWPTHLSPTSAEWSWSSNSHQPSPYLHLSSMLSWPPPPSSYSYSTKPQQLTPYPHPELKPPPSQPLYPSFSCHQGAYRPQQASCQNDWSYKNWLNTTSPQPPPSSPSPLLSLYFYLRLSYTMALTAAPNNLTGTLPWRTPTTKPSMITATMTTSSILLLPLTPGIMALLTL
uniref:NADH dehydrogenase subunit 2 n=1 Tax=Tetraodon lineatus TaxID=1220758 RepID=A0A0S2IAA4_9TELE|nr:NADH dehydrogenase subunit 2 [Tetraodon lineatus]ALO20450.1 NADH dehydrogenase subunit 2 [Tetraodon lineatus]